MSFDTIKNRIKKIAAALIIAALAVIICSCGFLPKMFRSENEKEPEISVEEMEIGGKYKHWFSKLSQNEKKAYNIILSRLGKPEEMLDFPKSIELVHLSSDEFNRVYRALIYDNPLLYYLTGGKLNAGKMFIPEYSILFSEYVSELAEINNTVEKVMPLIDKEQSGFEKELIIHDYLVKNCEYDDDTESGNHSNAAGAMLDGRASCEGYAKAAKLLLDSAGIENYLILGQAAESGADSVTHMWNVVKLDGDFYHLDVTWDDPVTEDGGNGTRHTYFNLNDEDISNTHSDFDSDEKCISDAENYFVKKGLAFDKFDEQTQMKIACVIAENLNSGDSITQVRFSDPESYTLCAKTLFEDERIYRLLEIAAVKTDKKIVTNAASYFADDNFNIIEISVKEK